MKVILIAFLLVLIDGKSRLNSKSYSSIKRVQKNLSLLKSKIFNISLQMYLMFLLE